MHFCLARLMLKLALASSKFVFTSTEFEQIHKFSCAISDLPNHTRSEQQDWHAQPKSVRVCVGGRERAREKERQRKGSKDKKVLIYQSRKHLTKIRVQRSLVSLAIEPELLRCALKHVLPGVKE